MTAILTENIDKPNSHDISVYIEGGGYKALEKALQTTPDDIIAEIQKSGLLGRGGAAFPVAMKWTFVRREAAQQKYIICNADEGEPGTFKDRVILKHDPHLVVEGLVIAGYAIGASQGYVYIRGEYYKEIAAMKNAIEQAREKGYLGQKILGSDFSFDIDIYIGAGAYVCGEETSLIESMSGMRACPNCRPPFPAQSGFMDKPTAVNNVETLANVPHIINNGAAWYADIGVEGSTGTKLFCLSGHVNKPGVYELPFNLTIRELINDHGGGMKGGKFKAALTGGVSSSLVTDIDVRLDYRSVAAAGSMLGSASVIVMNDKTDMVDVAKNTISFFAHESCGKCSICREGTRQAKKILTNITKNEGKPGDIELLQELTTVLMDAACCGLGQASMNVPSSAIKYFRNEFEARVRSR